MATTTRTLSLMCFWGGNINEGPDGSFYDGQPKKVVRAKSKIRYEELLDKLYNVSDTNRSHFTLKVLCRYPFTEVGMGGRTTYMLMPIQDDEDITTMFDLQTRFPDLTCVQLFVEMEPLRLGQGSYSQLMTQEYESLNLDAHSLPEAYCSGGRSQYTDVSPSQLEQCTQHDGVSRSMHSMAYGMGRNSHLADGREFCHGSYEPVNDGIHPSSQWIDVGGRVVGNEGDSWVHRMESNFDNEELDTDVEDDEERFNEMLDAEVDNVEAVEPSTQSPVPSRMEEDEPPFYTNIEQASGSVVAGRNLYGCARPFDPLTDELQSGLLFKNKEELQIAVKRYHIKKRVRFVVVDSEVRVWAVKCKLPDKCLFFLRATLKKTHGLFEVTKYNGPHTCLYAAMNQDHIQLDAKLVAKEIQGEVSKDPSISIVNIIENVWKVYEHKISYTKAWHGKQKAIEHVYGGWIESYQRLPQYLAAIQKYNPNTVVEYQTRNTANPNEKILSRVFWAFRPCILGFKFCRPIISIDATFLRGRYQGNMLVAMGCDGNNQILPLAFAVVEGENQHSWGWFLQLLRQHIVPNDENLCLISDRHPGILKAVKDNMYWQPPYAYHRYCLRHVRSNFQKAFKSSHLRKLIWAAGSSHQVRKFNKIMEEMEKLDPFAKKWCDDIPLEKWKLVHDGGHRYGVLTTNISEVFNGVMKGSHGLPITALVHTSFSRCVEYFNCRHKEALVALSSNVRFVPHAITAYHEAQSNCSSHRVISFNSTDRPLFAVKTWSRQTSADNDQVVDFDQRTCTCGKLEIYRLPCSHVLACCSEMSIDPWGFVDNYYNTSMYSSVWSGRFHPLGHKDYWDDWLGPTFLPNPNLLRSKPGRAPSKRINNDMDIRLTKDPKRCGMCRELGHDRRKCPNKDRMLS